MRLVPLVMLVALATPAVAQRVLQQHLGPAGNRTGVGLRPAGDLDGDGVQDIAAPQPAMDGQPLISAVTVWSGRTGNVLHTFGGLLQYSAGNPLDAVGFGDGNGDGRDDLVVLTYTSVQAFSGATGLPLWQRPPNVGNYTSVCPLGDWNGDGRADVAVAVYNSGTSLVQFLSGSTGALLGQISGLINNDFVGTVRSLGDLSGDGRQDLVMGTSRQAYVLRTAPAATLRTIVPALNADCRQLEGIDLDGDGRGEVVLARFGAPTPQGSTGSVDVHDALTGALRLSIQTPATHAGQFGHGACALGDLDGDGIVDLGIGSSNGAPFGEVWACSGRTGQPLWILPGWNGFGGLGASVAALGDLDGDGFGDLAAGCASAVPAGGLAVISGRVLAEVTRLGGACGGGPFLPELGATRPVLAQSVSIVLRDGPSGSNGVLAFSARPPLPRYLGASTCTAFFDVGSWAILHASPLPQWSVSMPVPNAPQLAGLEVALQAFYSPTAGPLGMDLSNGLSARVGF